MKISAEFKNGMACLELVPEDKWEMALLVAIAKQSHKLDAMVTHKYKGHMSYGEVEIVKVILSPSGNVPEENIPIDN